MDLSFQTQKQHAYIVINSMEFFRLEKTPVVTWTGFCYQTDL